MIEDKKLAEIIGLKRKCGYWEVNNKYFFDKFECEDNDLSAIN